MHKTLFALLVIACILSCECKPKEKGGDKNKGGKSKGGKSKGGHSGEVHLPPLMPASCATFPQCASSLNATKPLLDACYALWNVSAPAKPTCKPPKDMSECQVNATMTCMSDKGLDIAPPEHPAKENMPPKVKGGKE